MMATRTARSLPMAAISIRIEPSGKETNRKSPLPLALAPLGVPTSSTGCYGSGSIAVVCQDGAKVIALRLRIDGRLIDGLLLETGAVPVGDGIDISRTD